jgi:hypothetical protein
MASCNILCDIFLNPLLPILDYRDLTLGRASQNDQPLPCRPVETESKECGHGVQGRGGGDGIMQL